jgi:uncharacterized protein
MGQPVVHFEIIGNDPAKLRGYYGELFGWESRTADAVTEKVSRPGRYGFVDARTAGINGGIGGGLGHQPAVLFYVGVPDVDAALRQAESLGGRRLMGPEPESGDFTVGHFADPEGNVIGVAGPSAEQLSRSICASRRDRRLYSAVFSTRSTDPSRQSETGPGPATSPRSSCT